MSEWHEQRELIGWFRSKWPEFEKSIRVSMNGLNLGGGVRAARMVNQMRAQGMIDGEADIVLALPKGGYGALVLEHKAQGGNHKVQNNQQEYLDYHNGIGNCAVATTGVEAAKAAILTYMDL